MTDTTDPRLTSWLAINDGSDFPIQNLPFGMFTTAGQEPPSAGVAIGDQILDLRALVNADVMTMPAEAVTGSLNDLFELGIEPVRERVSELLTEGNNELADVANRGLVAQADATMAVPFVVGDYVDFYSSENHARNVGRMFRPSEPPLLPNWKHMPIAYHGRASTVAVSGTPVRRPSGQRNGPDGPTFGPSERLDIELEVGFFTSRGTPVGSVIPISQAEHHIGGVVLVNDWSARDLQAWEYRPLGPFLGKSFLTTVSPWVVTMRALEPFRETAPTQNPTPLPYLVDPDARSLSIDLSIELNGDVIGSTNFRHMYWTMAQQLTHAASNGTAVRTGDLYASGTVSGPERHEYGSLLEMSWNGDELIELSSGESRTFLADGDEVVLRGRCHADGATSIGFGECAGVVLAAMRMEDGDDR